MATTAAQEEYNNLFRDKSRRTAHPSDSPIDNSDAASFLNDDSSDDDRTQRANARRNSKHGAASFATAQSSASKAAYKIPTQRHQSNTGPKGVITDAQAYRAAARTKGRMSEGMSRASFQKERERQIGLTQPYVPSGLGANGDGRRASDEDEDEEEDEEVDEGFMEEWRSQRLREMQGQGGRRVGSGSRGGGRARFGGLVPVDGSGYLEAVDGSGGSTVVVVYIYDDRSEVSELIEECIATLARKYVNTRFVKLHYQEAEMEPAGVPAVLAYRGGDKFAGLVPVFNEIPDDADVDAETLEKLFQRHQIL